MDIRRRFAGTVMALAGLSLPATAHAQVPRADLGSPRARLAEPFSSLAGLRELSDGRLLAADAIEQSLWIIDPVRGTRDQLGRQGQGPGEYEMPGDLFALPGDSTLMLDRLNRRLTLILPDGRLSTSTISLGHPAGFPIFPRGVDAEGRIYFDLAGIMMPGLEDAAAAGRAPLLCWTPTSGAVDTVGFVQFPPMAGVTRPGEVRVELGGGPYQGRDEWSVTPDGRVGVARHQDYRVEWLATGRPSVSGPPIEYTPVKIGGAEKEAWADAMATRGLVVEEENGRRRVGRPPRPDVNRVEWPDVMPPFLAQAARATPEGELWVERAGPAGATQRVWDVFDRSGRRVRQVLLPPDRRIVGFGSGAVYVIRVDPDDLEWLEIYTR
jgi:hypothetical protein